jgi:AsmA protein
VDGADEALPQILAQLSMLSFEKLTIRRGTLLVEAQDRNSEILSDLSLEVVASSKGAYSAKGSASYRGTTVSFDGTWTMPAERTWPLRIPVKASIKAAYLGANIDGGLIVSGGLRLQGAADVSARKLREVARWFGVVGSPSIDLNDFRLKGTLDWSGGTLAFSRASMVMDGSESTGALAIGTFGPRPSIDGTLAFQHLDLSRFSGWAPSLASLWPLGFSAPEEEEASLLTKFDADLRMSAAKVTVPHLQTGAGAATIAVKKGQLQAEIAELEVEGGSFGGVIGADMSGPLPRYMLRGRLENVDAGRSLAGLLHRNPLQGRSTISLDVTGSGSDVADVLRTLSGKASITLNEGGRLGLDLRALLYAAQRADVVGWAAAGKGQTALEQLDARVNVAGGIATAEMLAAKSAGLVVSGSGSVDIANRLLDVTLEFSNAAPVDRTVQGNRLLLTGDWTSPSIRVDKLPRRAAAPSTAR